jgi:hypothetical protein
MARLALRKGTSTEFRDCAEKQSAGADDQGQTRGDIHTKRNTSQADRLRGNLGQSKFRIRTDRSELGHYPST